MHTCLAPMIVGGKGEWGFVPTRLAPIMQVSMFLKTLRPQYSVLAASKIPLFCTHDSCCLRVDDGENSVAPHGLRGRHTHSPSAAANRPADHNCARLGPKNHTPLADLPRCHQRRLRSAFCCLEKHRPPKPLVQPSNVTTRRPGVVDLDASSSLAWRPGVPATRCPVQT